jgi:outer membrane lipoprotein-sorting protein
VKNARTRNIDQPVAFIPVVGTGTQRPGTGEKRDGPLARPHILLGDDHDHSSPRLGARSWSKGDKQSLVRVIEPKKDAGNGTLLDDNNMWTFTPKINRIIKVPSSMMSQSWMGSDFSNKDISKSTDIIDQYDHELTRFEERDGHRFYTVTSVPHEDAAVVWGKEVLTVRDDYVLMEQQFWDQDGVLVKTLKTLEVEVMGGRAVAKIMRMGKKDVPDEWTQITANSIEFDLDLPANLFTLSNLRNPRQ